MTVREFQKYYQAPLPAFLAFFTVFAWQALGHYFMYQMEHAWFREHVYLSASIIGAVGVWMIWFGRNKSESAATMLGFIGGSLIWLSWIEFSFVYVAEDLKVEPVLWGAKDTLPEYRVMLSSIGVLLASLVFFVFNRETRCNAFMWLHRNLKLNPGEKTSGQQRNICSIVAMETIYVTWFFYIVLLVLYNPAFFGTDHWATFVACGFFFVWAIYLIRRLWWFQRVAPALRYAIPTAIILWNVVEILEKWGHIDEIWVQPHKYAFEIGITICAFIVTIVLAIVSPARRIVEPRNAEGTAP
jgi:hypothetical protein